MDFQKSKGQKTLLWRRFSAVWACRIIFGRFLEFSDMALEAILLLQPVWKPLCLHDINASLILRPRARGMVDITAVTAVIGQEEERHRIQNLLIFQVVIVSDLLVKGRIVNMEKTDGAMRIPHRRVGHDKFLKGKIDWVHQESCVSAGLALGQQARENNGKYPVMDRDGNTMCSYRLGQIVKTAWRREARKLAKGAGEPFAAERGGRGQFRVVLRIQKWVCPSNGTQIILKAE